MVPKSYQNIAIKFAKLLSVSKYLRSIVIAGTVTMTLKEHNYSLIAM